MGQVIKPDRKNSDLFPNSLQSLISSKLGQPGRAGVVSRKGLHQAHKGGALRDGFCSRSGATDEVLYRTVVLDTEAVTGAARRYSPA